MPVHPRSIKPSGPSKPLSVGEKIMVRTLGMKGVITALGEDDAEAQLGNLRVRVSFDDILRAGEDDDENQRKPGWKTKNELPRA